MRSELIALVPGILSWWMIASESVEAAFLGVYLPVLLLIPDYFRLPIDGLPDPSFSQAAILPIGVAVCWKAIVRREWNFSVLDVCVTSFVAWQFISDFHNVGYVDAQNLMSDMVTLAFLPYVCGKMLIESAGLRVRFARRFVFLLFVVCILSLYEFRMGVSLFRPLFQRFFPYQDSGWFTQMRFGLGRIAGPYGHAILMGTILAIGLLVCRWLSRSGLWEPDFKGLGHVYFKKGQILTAGLVIAMGMTISRGPWLGALCGLVIASIGAGVDVKRAGARAMILLAVIGGLVYAGGKAYLASTPSPDDMRREALEKGVSEVEQSAVYRSELFDKYVDIAIEREYWGWGRANWPQVPGMSSIDNNYLLMFLNTGLVGVLLFLSMLLVASWQLTRGGFSTSKDELAERSFHFTLMGVLVAIAISTGSVFLGSQLYPLLFLFLGWSDACATRQLARAEARAAERLRPVFNFVRVVA